MLRAFFISQRKPATRQALMPFQDEEEREGLHPRALGFSGSYIREKFSVRAIHDDVAVTP